MPQDATKILLGSVNSSDRVVSREDAVPASFPVGRVVRGKSDGSISLASGDGALYGVSLGKSLSDTSKTAVCRAGNGVPVGLAEYLTKAQLTFVSKRPGIAIAIEFLDTATAGSEEATVTGDDESGYLISLAMDSTTSTTTQCKAALDADEDTAALIETIIASGQGSTAVTAFAEDDIDGYPTVIGGLVRVSNVTGLAIPVGANGGTITKAIYTSASKDGVDPDSLEVTHKFAFVDMRGGLL